MLVLQLIFIQKFQVRAFFSDTVFALIAAYLVSLSIELPFINLESIIFPRSKYHIFH